MLLMAPVVEVAFTPPGAAGVEGGDGEEGSGDDCCNGWCCASDAADEVSGDTLSEDEEAGDDESEIGGTGTGICTRVGSRGCSLQYFQLRGSPLGSTVRLVYHCLVNPVAVKSGSSGA